MNRELFEPIVTVLVGIVGVAMVAILVSNKSQTGNVLAAGGGAFANAISAAVSPVTGNAAAPNVNAGAQSGGLTGFAGGNIGQGLSLSANLFS